MPPTQQANQTEPKFTQNTAQKYSRVKILLMIISVLIIILILVYGFKIYNQSKAPDAISFLGENILTRSGAGSSECKQPRPANPPVCVGSGVMKYEAFDSSPRVCNFYTTYSSCGEGYICNDERTACRPLCDNPPPKPANNGQCIPGTRNTYGYILNTETCSWESLDNLCVSTCGIPNEPDSCDGFTYSDYEWNDEMCRYELNKKTSCSTSCGYQKPQSECSGSLAINYYVPFSSSDDSCNAKRTEWDCADEGKVCAIDDDSKAVCR